jgi:pseudouridine-5'-phosphate glycosidase
LSHPDLKFSADVRRALRQGSPLVALESAVITHGLPRPENLNLAHEMQRQVQESGATPATIALLGGRICIGLDHQELRQLAESSSAVKVSQRDLAAVLSSKADGGTTVAGTMSAAHLAGIAVFATGGIGGVHRESPFDVSTDLHALAEIPMIVVCAGAKAILDLPATLERLESTGVPVIGYGTEEFPAFYSRESGLGVSLRLDSPAEVAGFARRHWSLSLSSAVLVVNPIPQMDAIPVGELRPILDQATAEAFERGVRGPGLTPFLLARVNELSSGRSLKANLSLLLNNARLAAQIAGAMNKKTMEKNI